MPSPKRLKLAEPAPPAYKVADVAEVEAAAEALKDGFLHCRDFGHNWKIGSMVRVGAVYDQWLFCRSCKTNRRRQLSGNGDIMDSSYQYQEGYQLKGMGRMLSDGRSALRRETLNRQIAKGEMLDGYPDDEDDTTVTEPVRVRKHA